jgi:hypothetical protein
VEQSNAEKSFKPVFSLFSSFLVGRREFMSLKIVAISIMNGNGKSSCELPFKVLRFVAFIYYHRASAAAFFNFPHLILQCGGGGMKKSSKNKHEKVKMKRLRNVEKLLFFPFLPLFKEQGEEIDCRSETINEVVAAWVVITCLNRHILCFQKSSFFFFALFFLMSHEITKDKKKV